jgi:hypothetical protein
MFLFQRFKNLKRLRKPIRVSNQAFLDRGYYKIRLKRYRSNTNFSVFISDYIVRFNLEDVPGEYLFRALLFCFLDIFFILKHNSITDQGLSQVRVVLSAPSLKNNINLKNIALTKAGAGVLLDEIEKTSQSNEHFLLDDDLEVKFISTKIDLNKLRATRQGRAPARR